jgi:hypothetical protein
MRTILLGLLASLLSVSCGDPVPGPEPVAREVISALGAKLARSNLKPIYERLSSGTKAALKARADELRRTTGNPELKDWEVLGPNALVFGDRVSKVSVLEEGDTTAKVELTMLPFIPGAKGADAQNSKSVILTLVKEEGQWRVDLPLTATSD